MNKSNAVLSLGFLVVASILADARSAVGSEEFSGCRGNSRSFRCCTSDYAQGSGLFEMLSTRSSFGRRCRARGGVLKQSGRDCTVYTDTMGRFRNQVRIECDRSPQRPTSVVVAPPVSSPRPTVAPPVVAPPGVDVDPVVPLTAPMADHSLFSGRVAGLIGQSLLDVGLRIHYSFGARTYLDYGFLGSGLNHWTDLYLSSARRNGVIVQIGFEPYIRVTQEEYLEVLQMGLIPGEFRLHTRGDLSIEFTLKQVVAALSGKGVLEETGLSPAVNLRRKLYNQFHRGVVRWAKGLREHGELARSEGAVGTVILRPLSEMNEKSARWQLMSEESRALESRPGQVEARAEAYARVWSMIREIFQDQGATNVKFMFAPLAYPGNHEDRFREGTRATLQALDRIPADEIDLLGLNVYTTDFQSPREIRENGFTNLSRQWVRWMRAVPGMASKPLGVGEMGVASYSSSGGPVNQEGDRVRWIREAFSGAKAMGFSLVTYFNRDKWACAQEYCNSALGEAIQLFQER